jgi:hypothetical protein
MNWSGTPGVQDWSVLYARWRHCFAWRQRVLRRPGRRGKSKEGCPQCLPEVGGATRPVHAAVLALLLFSRWRRQRRRSSGLEGSRTSLGLEVSNYFRRSGSSAKDDIGRTMAAAQRSCWVACCWSSRCWASRHWSWRWWTARGWTRSLLGIAGEVLAGARGPRVLPHGRAKVPELSQEDKRVYTTEWDCSPQSVLLWCCPQ